MKFTLILLSFFIPFKVLAQSPGNVNSNLTFWLKADAGIIQNNGKVSQWNDQASGLHVSEGDVNKQPDIITDTINYYPAVFFTTNRPLTRSIGNNYNALVNATTGNNVNTTGSVFTVASSRREQGNILSQFPNPICGDFVISSGLYAGKLLAGGRSAQSGSFPLSDPQKPFIATALEAPGAGNSAHYLDGGDERIVTNTTNNVCVANHFIRVGAGFRGSIAEVITFKVKLSDTERRKVESYLALKYGITIDNLNGGINGDYFVADGTTVWDADANGDYHNRIIGIGRDDSSGLYQRQSHDYGDNARIYLDTLAVTNAANTGSFSSNKQFILMGDNNAPFSNNGMNNEYPLNRGIVNRISREWKITNTGFTGTFSIDLKPEGGSYDASHIRILIDEDGDFSTGAIMYSPVTGYSAGVLSLSGISGAMIPVNTTRYLAVVTVSSPGGVLGASLWVKADDGVYADSGTIPAGSGDAVTLWSDRSDSGNHLSQSLTSEKPTFLNSSVAFNYNPVVQFINNFLKTNNSTGLFENGVTYNDIHLYTVHYDSAATDFDWLYYEGDVPNNNRISSSRDYPGGGNNANYSITTDNSLLVSTISAIPTATTNIVGHHAGTGGNYGQANNRYTALMVNGKEAASSSVFSGYTVAAESDFYLGDNETGNDSQDSPFTGDVGEVIVFRKSLTAGERNRLESYLAVKYGKTLDNSAGGTDGDYLLSDNTIIWDASNSAVYHNDVIAIVRDNTSGLLQRQSHQADDSTRLYLSALVAGNAQNTGVIAKNLSSVAIGHNKGMLGENSVANSEIPLGSLVSSRLQREWKVTNTAFNQPFNMDIRLNSTGLGTINTANLALMVDDDGNFDNALIYFPSDGLSFSYAAGVLSIAGITTTMIPVNTTRYITVSKIAVTPGGVTGVRIWTKADAGVYSDYGTVLADNGEAVAQWNDFSGNNIHLFQQTVSERPVLLNGDAVTFNYNPVIYFTDSYLKTVLGDGVFVNGQTYNDINIYTVYNDIDDNNFDWLYYEGSGVFTNRVSASFNFSNNNRADFDVRTGSGNRLFTYTNSALLTGTTHIVAHHRSNSGTSGQASNRYGALVVNGREVHSVPSFPGYVPVSTSDFYLGNNKTGNGDDQDNPFMGYVGELLIYVDSLTASQRNQIESYLAIKYGKTLDNSAGGIDGDYLSSTGGLLWDASEGSSYHNNIIGIARDDNSALYQRQSHLANDSVRVYVGNLAATNSSNTSLFAQDEQFILMGDNNAAIANNTGNTEYPANMGILYRTNREWKISNTGFTDDFSIAVKPAAGTYNAAAIRVLIDDDGDFSNAVLHAPEVSYVGGVLTLSGISTAMVPSGSTRYLTIVTIASPGGIAPSLWVKANEAVFTAGGSFAANGEAVHRWADLSGSNNNLSQEAAGNRPLFRDGSADAFNYNPALFLNSITNSYLTTVNSDGLFANGKTYDNINIYTAHQDLSAADFNWLYYEGDYQNRVSAGYNFPGSATAFYNVNNDATEEASTETDIPTNTVNIVAHHTGSAGNYGQANDRYRALMVNGREVASSNTLFPGYTANSVSRFNVGNSTDANDDFESNFTGYIGEIIVYKDYLDATQRKKIESYMAIKYGKTLDNAAGGADGDYISAAATTIWDASLNSEYHRQVIGIGRDDNSTLLQKQSHTDDDTTRIYIAVLQSHNAANAGSFSADNSFLMTGNNGAPLLDANRNTEFPQGGAIYSRIDREWKITNTNFTGSFAMDIKLNTMPVTAADLRILIDEDGDFSNATVYSSPDVTIGYNNGVVTISGISNSLLPVNQTRYLTIASTSASTPLPLRLLEFTATKNNRNTIWLNWSTILERNVRHFEIERSPDGAVWKQLDIVPASNTSGVNQYQFEDDKPEPGMNYYRLKMVELSMDYEYSPVRSVNIYGLADWVIYPNPVNNEITITGAVYKPGEVGVTDMLGRDLRSQISFRLAGGNVMAIDVSKLTSGMYMLRVKQKTFKIFKQ